MIYAFGEGFDEISFSTKTCERIYKNPYTIRHAGDRQWRLHGLGPSDWDAPHYIIEHWDSKLKRYVELCDIDAFFTKLLYEPLTGVIWAESNSAKVKQVQQNGKTDTPAPSLYFINVQSNERDYYTVDIERLPLN